MTTNLNRALQIGFVAAIAVALWLLPQGIPWRLYLSLVGGAFMLPVLSHYHLASPNQIVRDEEVPTEQPPPVTPPGVAG